MDWSKVIDALSETRRGARLVAQSSASDENRRRAMIVEDMTAAWINALSRGLEKSE